MWHWWAFQICRCPMPVWIQTFKPESNREKYNIFASQFWKAIVLSDKCDCLLQDQNSHQEVCCIQGYKVNLPIINKWPNATQILHQLKKWIRKIAFLMWTSISFTEKQFQLCDSNASLFLELVLSNTEKLIFKNCYTSDQSRRINDVHNILYVREA